MHGLTRDQKKYALLQAECAAWKWLMTWGTDLTDPDMIAAADALTDLAYRIENIRRNI